MSIAPPERATSRPRARLRLWPGGGLVLLQWLAAVMVPGFFPQAMLWGLLVGLVATVGIVVWWTFFSRAPVLERAGTLLLAVAGLALTPRVLHESLATAGMGVLFYVYAIPTVSLALVAGAAVSRNLPDARRRATLAAAVLLGCGVWALVRTGGINGEGQSDFAWRWSATPEERLLASVAETSAAPAAPSGPVDMDTGPGWPGFRGPRRDGVVRGSAIETDWQAAPPVELWRRAIGPGWSSFAVRGDLLYTQEQRGEDEIVAAYRVRTGEPLWQHRDATRFWESNGGPGPRATPTLRGDRVYAFGATGILNALDAGTGASIWSRHVDVDTDVGVPGWGFASSPLAIDDLVVVAAAGRLAAYDLVTGEPRWLGPAAGNDVYSSPQLLTLDGVPQIVLLAGRGAISVEPASGTVLWQDEWRGAPIVQPALIGGGDLLVTTADASGGLGMRRLGLIRGAGGWTVRERWTSRDLKPYFNDYVVHEGHAYGFDASILACIDLETGERVWKGGRYGHGQMVLLADQNVLLVLSEDGELALVSATPDRYRELARVPALQGKAWNHPVLVDDILLVRNGEEMAAFRLALARR